MLTAKQKQIRRMHLCASENAAILGLDRFKTPSDVFYNKRPDLLGIDVDAMDAMDNSNPAMDAGNHLEEYIIDNALSGDYKRVDTQAWKVADDGICACTLDALVDDKKIIEAKTAGLARMFGARLTNTVKHVNSTMTYRAFCAGIDTGEYWYAPEFGDGTAEIPDAYYLQTQMQMYCAGIDEVILAACIAGRGHVEYQIARDDQIIEMLVKAAHNFMEHVRQGKAPEGAPPIDMLKIRKREPGKIITFGDDKIVLLSEYRRLKQEADDIAKLAEDAKSAIIAELGDAEIGQFPSGAKITYKEQTASRIDAALLRKDYPEVAEAVTKTTVSRVARITEPKVKEN